MNCSPGIGGWAQRELFWYMVKKKSCASSALLTDTHVEMRTQGQVFSL
jgi:hypothetical protein